MKITQKYLEKKGREIADIIKQMPGVKAIVFHGGVGWDVVDDESDIDISVFCTKLPDVKKRREILTKTGRVRYLEKYGHVEGRQDLFFFDGMKNYTGIDYFTIKDTNKTLGEIKKIGRLTSDWPHRSLLAHTYEVKIIWDPNRIVKNWQKEIKPYFLKLKKLTPWLIEHISQLRWVEETTSSSKYRKDYVVLSANFNNQLNTYLLALFLLNNKYLDFPKKVGMKISKLKYKPKNCSKRLDDIAKLGNNPSEYVKKMNLLQKLGEETEVLVKKYFK